MVTTEPADTPKALRTVVAVLGVALGGLLGGSALVLLGILGVRAVGVSLTPFAFIVISLVLFQGVALGGVALGYLRYRGLNLDYVGVRVPSLRELVIVVVGYVLALGAAITGAIAVSATGVEAGSNQAAELGAENPEVLLLLIPASFIFIGPGEELLFRGIVQSRLRERFGAAPSVVGAAVLFAAIHYAALSGSAGGRLVSIGLLLLPSLVFGTAYELTRNVVVPALIHGAYNATLFSLLYVAIRFADVAPPGAV